MSTNGQAPVAPRHRRRRYVGALLLLLALGAAPWTRRPAHADEESEVPSDVPVTIEARVDARDAADLGRWRLTLVFQPLADIDRAYRIELRLLHGNREVLALDHSPDPPTPRWRRGEIVTYEIPVPMPFEAGLQTGDRLDVRVGFFDPEVKQTIPPRTDRALPGNRQKVAELTVPDLGPTDGEERIGRILEHARALAEEGRKADAWKTLERGIRRAEEDATKARFRDAILALGHFEPAPPSLLEREIVRSRIARELRRHLRRMAGRYYDQGKLYAALRILEAIGGTLAEEANAAVIGALAQAQRAEKDIQQIHVRLLARITEDDKEKARREIRRLGLSRALLAKANEWFKAKHYGRARFLLRDLSLVSERDLATDARTRLDALEEAWLEETPPDEADLVEEALNHPAFDRLATVATHNFIYIGPKVLVENIPPMSRLRFDLAYVFLTDLFGRVPNPGGDRITVFFKELWDFGGGQAGGKTIDIGRADPEQRGYRVDTGLLYHELTHCVDDTSPILAGWREGLANMGAAYTFEALGQAGDDLHAFNANLNAFLEDYLDRDLAYWRIPGYGPSAGFFLYFVEEYTRTERGHDWKPYRKFFREYRKSPMRDGREPCVIRAFAWYLIRAFGPKAFDDLLRFRLPLVESDRDAIGLEVRAFSRGEYHIARLADEFGFYPNSPLPRDLLARQLLGANRRGGRPEEVKRIGREKLGILYDWRVIGPFRSKGADPWACVFPPEREIDFAREYADDFNVCKWRLAGEGPVVTVSPMGWVSFNFSYQDDTATYALTHVTVDEDQEVHVHIRADDDFTLFVNDRLVNGYRNRGSNGSDWLWWRGPAQRVPDAMRLPIRLHAGRNKLLLKVKNRVGGAGFILALSRPDGGPIMNLATDVDPSSEESTSARRPARASWKTVLRHVFRTKSFSSKLETAVGSFRIVNRRLIGQSTDGRVAWRKYTVRPGFPKDSPSNLVWIRAKHTEDVSDFRLTLDLAPRNGGVPKIAVTFQGEGGDDGLSGWTLIVHPRGEGLLGARLERYDRLVCQTKPLDAPGGEIQPLVLTYRDRRLTVTLGDLVLFEDVPITPIPGRHRIGFATFGPSPGLAELRLEASK